MLMGMLLAHGNCRNFDRFTKFFMQGLFVQQLFLPFLQFIIAEEEQEEEEE